MNSILLDEVVPHDSEVRPYLRLWAEVMRQGVGDFCTARGRRENNNNPHAEWLYSNATGVGTFVWLCDLFEFDPDKARSQVLKNWRAHVDKREVLISSRKKRHG